MDYPDCYCCLKRDLEKTEDVFSFIEANFPLDPILENLNELSEKELRCTTCILCTAFMKLPEPSLWGKLIRGNILNRLKKTK